MSYACDVAVIGGGIIGRSVAFELARRGAGRIAVVDHGSLGGEPSPCAAGLLPVASMRTPRGILFDLASGSLALYPDFLARVAEAGGTAPSLSHAPFLQLAENEAAAEELRRRVRRRATSGHEAEWLGPGELRRLPQLADGFLAGALFAREAQVEGPALLAALRAALDRLGVEWIHGRARLDASRPGVPRLVVGARSIVAARIVLAAGWWSTDLAAALGATLPVRAARGEMIEVAAAGGSPEIIIDHGALLIPRGGGRVWIGGLMEFDSHGAPTDDGRRALIERAAAVWPHAARARVLSHWAGVRPCSTIRHPIVDRVPGWDDVYVAAGHHRSGFLLAPLTAAIIAARVFAEPLPVEQRAVSWKYRARGR